MATLLTPYYQAVDGNGLPLSGATLAVYEAGTTTPVTIYADAGATTPLTNPVVASAPGRFAAIFLVDGEYKTVLKDSEGTTLQTIDDISIVTPGALTDGSVNEAAMNATFLETLSASNSFANRAAFEAADINGGARVATVIEDGILVRLIRDVSGSWESGDGATWSVADQQGVAATAVAADLSGYGWVIGDASGGNIADYGAGTILTNLHTGQLNVLEDSRHLRGIIGGYDNWITGGGTDIHSGVSTGVDGGEACWIVGGHHSEIIGQSTHGSIFGGSTGIIDGHYDFIAGGSLNTIVGDYAFAAGIANEVRTATAGSIPGGRDNRVTADYGRAGGYQSIAQFRSSDAYADGQFAVRGDAQVERIVRKLSTTDATQTNIGTLTMPIDTTWGFEVRIAARRTDANGESAYYKIEGAIDINGAATAALVGAGITKTVVAEDTSAWDVTAVASTTGLQVLVTGEAAKTIYWVASYTLVEVTG